MQSRRISAVLAEDRSESLVRDCPGHPLRYAVVSLTSECNLACAYCYSTSDLIEQGTQMSADTALRIVDQISSSKHRQGFLLDVCWSGGEVLLRQELLCHLVEETLSLRQERDVVMGLQTNATLLTQKTSRMLGRYGLYVGLSVDGYEELNDKCRIYPEGRGSFADVENAMSVLRADDIPFGVILVITKANAKHIRQIIDWLYGQGIRSASFNSFEPLGRGKGSEPFALTLSEQIETAQAIIGRMIDINTTAAPSDRFVERNSGALARNMVFLRSRPMCNLRSPCAAGSNFLHFEPNGDIYPCDQFMEYPSFKLGNIWIDTVDEIWTSHPTLSKLRSRTIYSIDECATCHWRLICCGGCPASALRLNGDLFTPGSACAKHRVLIPWLISEIRSRDLSFDILAFPNREGFPQREGMREDSND